MEMASARMPQQQATAEMEQAKKAAGEVDQELLELALARSPRERLRVATRAQRALRKFHPHAPR